MRGDRYRDALTVIDTIERVRPRPDVLLTGHFRPIQRRRANPGRSSGSATRSASCDATVARHEREAGRPPPDAEIAAGRPGVGGYGKVAWDVRAVWEKLFGLVPPPLHRRAVPRRPVRRECRPGGPGRGRRHRRSGAGHLDAGRPVAGIQLAELVTDTGPDHAGAAGCSGRPRTAARRLRQLWGDRMADRSRSRATRERAGSLRLRRCSRADHRASVGSALRPRHCSGTPARTSPSPAPEWCGRLRHRPVRDDYAQLVLTGPDSRGGGGGAASSTSCW